MLCGAVLCSQAKLLAAASEVDRKQGWRLLEARPVAPRLIEVHAVRGGPADSLLHTRHYDKGSLLTLDVRCIHGIRHDTPRTIWT